MTVIRSLAATTSLILPLVLLAHCSSESSDESPLTSSLTPDELTLVAALSPLPALPASPSNAFADNADAAVLGQRLFFERSWSGPLRLASDLGAEGATGALSCSSCHSGVAFDDRRSQPGNVSMGAGSHRRNAPPVVNSAYYPWTNWGGRFDSQWALPRAVLEAGIIHNSSRLRVAHVVFDKYREQYDAIFPNALDAALDSTAADASRFPAAGKPAGADADDGPWEGMTAQDRRHINRVAANVGKAIEAYMRLLVSENSPFDQFAAGDQGALSASEQNGLGLFVGKAGCANCHSGPLLSDGAFHNTGVAQLGPNVPEADGGRFGDLGGLLGDIFNTVGEFSDDTVYGASKLAGLSTPAPDAEMAKFRTPSLRQIGVTEPYFHAGQFSTLEEVVSFYNDGGGASGVGEKDVELVPLGLTDAQQADLVAFLKTLTGQPVDAALSEDTSAP